MEGQEDQEATDVEARDSNQRGIRSFFSKIKQRAVNSLICSSANVVPVNDQSIPGDAPAQQTENNDASASASVGNSRTFGVVDLKIEALDVVKVEDEDENGVETYEIVEDYDPELIEPDVDDIWEDNMWKKLHLMKNERKPIDFRLYLVDMVRYSAKIDDLKSMGIYIMQLQREYQIYDNPEKIDKDPSRSKGRTKFRVDGLVEDLILRLVSLRVGSDVSWKRTVNLICDRMKKNMAPKPKVDIDELPKIFFRGRATTAQDVSDSWFLYSTIDLTGYDLQGDSDAEELRRRLGIFLSIRPLILVKLNLSYTGLDKKSFLPLLPYIAELRSLQELDLRGNRLDTSILKYFYPYLGKFGDKFRSGFSSLRWVYFNHNVDINCLPIRFIMGVERRWPPIEHRPSPQELTENRASACDFSKIERVQARLIEKRTQLQKSARLVNVSKEKDLRDRKKAAFLRRVAGAANQLLAADASLIRDMSPTSELGPLSGTLLDPEIDGSDAGRVESSRLARGQRVSRPARASAAAVLAIAGNNRNANGNHARG
ncbi:uncharacterized protein LOC105437653 [Strongylocentrotus purpuratus]|uniref:Uncharacterized protein n=1 Tax=Strongylocentrotus purpuratus TaxID=7668 RepID=A0A7M7NE41_STRPU|nr:uncharacterized protein LOC105437653 [Strongylocentrotus purpuratus]